MVPEPTMEMRSAAGPIHNINPAQPAALCIVMTSIFLPDTYLTVGEPPHMVPEMSPSASASLNHAHIRCESPSNEAVCLVKACIVASSHTLVQV